MGEGRHELYIYKSIVHVEEFVLTNWKEQLKIFTNDIYVYATVNAQ
jgi:hypothetical protein